MIFKRSLLLTALALSSAVYAMEPNQTTTVEQAQSTDTLELLFKELTISEDDFDQTTLSLLKEKITQIFYESTEKDLLAGQGVNDAVLQYMLTNPTATGDQILAKRKATLTQALTKYYNDFDQAVASLNEFIHVDPETLKNAIKKVTDQAMADALFKQITNIIRSDKSNALIVAKLMLMGLESERHLFESQKMISFIEDEATKTRFCEELNAQQRAVNLMKLQHTEFINNIRNIEASDEVLFAVNASLTPEDVFAMTRNKRDRDNESRGGSRRKNPRNRDSDEDAS